MGGEEYDRVSKNVRDAVCGGERRHRRAGEYPVGMKLPEQAASGAAASGGAVHRYDAR